MKKTGKKYYELRALKGKMRSEGQTTRTMADYLGMATNTFSLKINGISEFGCSEVGEICKILGIRKEDIVEYFFPVTFREETKIS